MGTLAASLAGAAPKARVTADGAVLANEAIRCEFRREQGTWRLDRLSRPDGSSPVKVAAEPLILALYEGPELDGDAFRCTSVSARHAEEEARLLVTLECAQPRVNATLTYWLTGDQPYLRKQVTLTGDAGVLVDELRLLDGTIEAPVAGGGRGLPLWIGQSWWLGVEYPLGYAEVTEDGVRLKHFPGRDLAEPLQSKAMVIGVAPPGRSARTGFAEYVRAIKRPSRSHLQYNSWYDLRRDEMTPENLLATAEGFREKLLEPYGLQMHSFVPDDGWQAPQSVWEPRTDLYPQGFSPVADALERMGMRLGLWMPLTGSHLDMHWAARQGYEVSDRGAYFCLSTPGSFEAMKRATQRRIREGRLAYYKHDFNFLSCTAQGHGHLPTDRHSREANLDALLRLLAWERECNPGVFQNVTSAVWLSPWWLPHCDTIWMCARDFGYEKTFPQLAPREWAMSYRDAHFHTVYVRGDNPTPLASLMTHGIIKGRRNRLGGKDETLREWADYVALYFGRGVLLKELYITPDLLDDAHWHALGTAARWATENWRTLERTRMFGGDPRRGEPYGYAHWRGSHGILALRNPSYRAMTLHVPIDEATGYLADHRGPFAVRQIYPAHVSLAVELSPGGSNELTLPPCSVWLLELRAEAAWPSAPPRPEMPGPARTLRDTGRMARSGERAVEVMCSLDTVRAPHERLEVYAILRGDVERFDVRATLGGQELAVRRAEGDGWGLCAFDLLPDIAEQDDLRVEVGADEAPPLFPPWATLEVWMIGDAGVHEESDPFADEALPWACAQGCRRYSVRLLPQTRLEALAADTAGPITDEQLQAIQAARLRLEVFDVNSEERYGGKQILLNDRPVASVPVNRGELSAWQEHVIELPEEVLSGIARENRLVLTNAGGDCYKFRGLALAVQTAGGDWVVAGPDTGVYSSVGNWLYVEGETFRGERSPPVVLTFP
ncbi:MAG: hypothetical protein U9R79_14055 [Armatimonadota bacterium]|nr:hypothetical protein [Armatimonadota bacterium]